MTERKDYLLITQFRIRESQKFALQEFSKAHGVPMSEIVRQGIAAVIDGRISVNNAE